MGPAQKKPGELRPHSGARHSCYAGPQDPALLTCLAEGTNRVMSHKGSRCGAKRATPALTW